MGLIEESTGSYASVGPDDDKVSEGAVKAVQLADGSSIPCDAVVLAMGAWASGASMPSSTNLKLRSFRACSNIIAEPSIRFRQD